MWVIGAPQVVLETEATFYGSIIAPDALLLVKTKSRLDGAFYGKALEIITEAAIGGSGTVAGARSGYKVATEWIDAEGRFIAPHMLDVGKPVPATTSGWEGDLSDVRLAVVGKLTGKDPGTVIDAFDSSQGAYGGGNAGATFTMSTNGTSSALVSFQDLAVTGDVLCGPGGDPGTAIKLDGVTHTGSVGALDEAVAMPALDVPSDMGASTGDLTLSGSTVIDNDVHADKLVVVTGSFVEIDGDVRIMCENEFKAEPGAEIVLRDGATLEIWGKGNVKIYGARINANTTDPARVRIHVVNADTLEMDDGAELWALAQAPAGTLQMQNASSFFGRFAGAACTVSGGSGFHADLAGLAAPAPGCVTISDLAGAAGPSSSGGVTSKSSFEQWFRDVPGTNLSIGHVITLTRGVDGVYSFLDTAFDPVDGRLLGNEGAGDNRLFTFAVNADFVFQACSGQFVEVEGDDDIWLFVDGRLVADLGGTQANVSQFVELDRLGLEDGQRCMLSLFYANRQAGTAKLSIRTNLELSSERYLPSITAVFD
jgi:fibro-slime domain-containing protein